MFQRATLFILFCSISLFLLQCGQWDTAQQQQDSLDIVLLQVDDNLPLTALSELTESFGKQHPGLIINATTEIVSPDESFSSLLQKIRYTDAIVYPSLLESSFQSHPNLFYPLSATSTQLPDALSAHYSPDNGTGVWSLPLLLDPVIMAIKKNAPRQVGDEFFPRSWNKIHLLSEFDSSGESFSYPNLMVYESTPWATTDTLAAYYLARGLFYDIVTGKGMDTSMEEMQLARQEFEVMQTLAFYMTGDRSSNTFQFVNTNSLQEMLNTKTMFTFLRYSHFLRQPKTIQDQFFIGIAPNPYDEIPVLCYSVNTSVTMESDKPEAAKEFVNFLSQAETWNGLKSGYLHADEFTSHPLLPKNHFIVLRTSPKTVHEKTVFDCLQKKMNVLEFSGIWLSPYSIVHKNVL